MQEVEKMHHIDVEVYGKVEKKVAQALVKKYPKLEIVNDDELVEWDKTDLAREIKASLTPGKILNAYRLRAGFSLTELAKKLGIKYSTLGVMENDLKIIGKSMAKKLGTILKVDYNKFL